MTPQLPKVSEIPWVEAQSRLDGCGVFFLGGVRGEATSFAFGKDEKNHPSFPN